MLEILVARVEVVPKFIPLIIIHKPVVALARLTRALHGTRVRVRGWTESDAEDGRGKVSEISISFTRRDDGVECVQVFRQNRSHSNHHG